MRFNHLLLAILIVAVWGFNFVVVKISMQDISPLALCALRFMLASLPFLFFVKRPKAPFKLIMLYGLFMFALQFSFLFVGMKLGVTAGLASLVVQTQIFFSILLGVLFLKDIPNKWQIIGALVSFAGIALIAVNLGTDVTITGLLFIIAAAIAWSIGNLASKKMGKVDVFSLVVWGSLVAMPPLLILTLTLEGYSNFINIFHHLSWQTAGALFYIVFISGLFGYAAWSWLLNIYSVTTVAPFALLVPIFGILSSALVLNEELQTWKVIAAILVIAGLCINVLWARFIMLKKFEAPPLAEGDA